MPNHAPSANRPGTPGTPGTTVKSAPAPSRLHTIMSTGVGNALEWYDWNVYAIFTPSSPRSSSLPLIRPRRS